MFWVLIFRVSDKNCIDMSHRVANEYANSLYRDALLTKSSRYIFTSYRQKKTRTDKVLDTSSRYKNTPIVAFSLELTCRYFTTYCHFEYSIDAGNGMYREVTSSHFSSLREKLFRDAHTIK